MSNVVTLRYYSDSVQLKTRCVLYKIHEEDEDTTLPLPNNQKAEQPHLTSPPGAPSGSITHLPNLGKLLGVVLCPLFTLFPQSNNSGVAGFDRRTVWSSCEREWQAGSKKWTKNAANETAQVNCCGKMSCANPGWFVLNADKYREAVETGT
ncbi:hypothetical protein V6N11_053505 [Hibiscus sabdariffa]|uniref:Uncharacterized protein n=1 Tax=Hibiscus sabdariffa TaxID=183260 RepID=A0ABR2UD97_9ROSI